MFPPYIYCDIPVARLSATVSVYFKNSVFFEKLTRRASQTHCDLHLVEDSHSLRHGHCKGFRDPEPLNRFYSRREIRMFSHGIWKHVSIIETHCYHWAPPKAYPQPARDVSLSLSKCIFDWILIKIRKNFKNVSLKIETFFKLWMRVSFKQMELSKHGQSTN